MLKSTVEKIGSNKSFGGWQHRFRHASATLNCDMVFSVYLPPRAEHGPVPVLYWLSGLTCNDQNFVTKAGAQRYAAEHGIAIVAPDTSPRGDGVPDEAGWDMGQGAGFYVNATQEPWRKHFQMYDYIVDELPALIADNFPIDVTRSGISGHSMGGHGALVAALRNPQKFRSVSAFAPICAPSQCAWGEKAFNAYLGADRKTWAAYDACELLASTQLATPILVDQGEADEFLAQQLLPEQLQATAKRHGQALTLRRHAGYDHSYFFIASFIEDHLRFHADLLHR
jgi:S-formylglutathione hydrolase